MAGNKRSARKSGASKHREAPPVSQLRLALGILLIALFAIALVLLNRIEAPATQTTAAGKQQPASQTEVYTDDDYTFYSKLKSFEVSVAADSSYRSTDSEPFHYLIQAGAFRTDEQAQRRLVELKLLGLEPVVDTATNASGTRWHRVRLGPFNSRSKLAGARALILENGMEAIVMKPRSG